MKNILEFVQFSGSTTHKIDREKGIIYDVKILGQNSKNGRFYPENTLKQALSLYENAKVNINHPENAPTETRKYQDRVGVIKDIRYVTDDGLYGNFYYNPKHVVAEQLLWDAEHIPDNVGFSHNVEACVVTNNHRQIVEEIKKVISVDLVADPATTNGLFESMDSAGTAVNADIPHGTFSGNNSENHDDTITREKNQLLEQLSECNKKQAILETILEYYTNGKFSFVTEDISHLMDRSFIETLLKFDDPEAVKMILEDRAILIKTLKESTKNKQLTSIKSRSMMDYSDNCDTKSFVKSIKICK